MDHECFECGKTFSRRSHLERHSWSHSKISPFQCHFCSSYFTQKGSLERHLLTHDDEKPYHCSICAEFKCETQNGLNEHYEGCQGKQFKCDLCPSTFTSKSGIWAHRTSRHPTTFHFKCTHCNRPPFLTQEIFELHFKKRHQDLEKGEFKKVLEIEGKWMEQVASNGIVMWKAVERVENKKEKRKKEKMAELEALKPQGDILEAIIPLVKELAPPVSPIPSFLQNLQTLSSIYFPAPADHNDNTDNSQAITEPLAQPEPLLFVNPEAWFAPMSPFDNNDNSQALMRDEPFGFDLEADNNHNADHITFDLAPRSIESTFPAFNPDEELWFNPESISRPESVLNTSVFSPASSGPRYEDEELCLTGLIE